MTFPSIFDIFGCACDCRQVQVQVFSWMGQRDSRQFECLVTEPQLNAVKSEEMAGRQCSTRLDGIRSRTQVEFLISAIKSDSYFTIIYNLIYLLFFCLPLKQQNIGLLDISKLFGMRVFYDVTGGNNSESETVDILYTASLSELQEVTGLYL